MSEGIFPFGQPVERVIQSGREPKQVFVLGYYASAVHARWVNSAGTELVKALAVASEPYIFWNGDGAESILKRIKVPTEVGQLVLPQPVYNGSSGNSLDEDYLKPLGLSRTEVWLCDLVPFSCMNNNQEKAVNKHYQPFVESGLLPKVYMQPKPQKSSVSVERLEEIASEIIESEAQILITLGNEALGWFAKQYGSKSSLAVYGKTIDEYGQTHSIEIQGREITLLPLVHPAIGRPTNPRIPNWHEIHVRWKNERAQSTADEIGRL